MAIPSITSITPATGPSSGGDIVRIAGVDFAPSVSVLFGDVEAEVAFVSSSPCVADVRTPAHVPATVDVTLRNLDDDGNPIPSEEIILADAYRFVREEIVRESDLTRVVRHILRRLKKQVLENTSISVSVDYDDTVVDGLNIVALAEMPSVVLSGPRLRENKFFGTYEAHEELIDGTFGPEVIRHSPPLTMDLEFSLTVASDRTAELLNLMAATATFLNRNRWMELSRDPANPIADMVRWEMDPRGEFRTNLNGPGDVKAFTCAFVIRGFDIDEGLPIDAGTLVYETHVDAEQIH